MVPQPSSILSFNLAFNCSVVCVWVQKCESKFVFSTRVSTYSIKYVGLKNRELKHTRRRQLRNRQLKSEFHLNQIVKYLWILPESVVFYRTESKFTKREKKSSSCAHVLHKTRRQFCDVVVQRRQRSVQLSSCFVYLNPTAFLSFWLMSPSSFLATRTSKRRQAQL